MEMELLESALTNWPLATYDNKLEVDANYKRMVDYGMQKDNAKAVHLGIASHNLFELAYAYNVAKKQPMKLAAMEGLYNGQVGTPLVLIGLTQDNDDAIGIKIPGMLSYLATRSFDGFVPGVNDILNGNEAHGIPPMDDRIDCKTIEEWCLLGDPSLKIGGYS